jgi:hypothetical protein
MRTKTLLLVAALSAAGVATSMAQVFSVNAVGYVNKKVAAGKLALISNPLDAGTGNNTIANLFKGLPPKTQIYKFNAAGTGYDIAEYDDIDNAYLPASAAALEVKPGEGVFVKNNSAAEITITFVGEVPQGTLVNQLPAGLSIRSSIVPQAGPIDTLGLVGAAKDQFYKFDPTAQAYQIWDFDDIDNAWIKAGVASVPAVDVGEAFFYRSNVAKTWTRTFTIP